jgi:hypothetical protein
MLGGNVPNGSASGSSVTLTWTASLFADGSTIPSYAIRRFNALTSAETTVLSACSGIVTGTTYTENGVPRIVEVHGHAGRRRLAWCPERSERGDSRLPLNFSERLTNP